MGVILSADGIGVRLRTLGVQDADGISKNANDAEIARNVARLGEFPFPYTIEDALAFIANALEKQDAGSEYHFGIIHGGETIGACALLNVDEGGAEIGYWLGRDHWGKGLASQAVRLLLVFGFDRLRLHTVHARTFRSNARSIRLLERLGFKPADEPAAVLSEGEAEYSIYKNAYSDSLKLAVEE